MITIFKIKKSFLFLFSYLIISFIVCFVLIMLKRSAKLKNYSFYLKSLKKYNFFIFIFFKIYLSDFGTKNEGTFILFMIIYVYKA